MAFEVRDGLTGFPDSLIRDEGKSIELRVIDGSLRIRSSGAALRYLDRPNRLADEEGFVDTGDVVEQRGDRYHSIGRGGGVVNVGGLKVHPEGVDDITNGHPNVHITGHGAEEPNHGLSLSGRRAPKVPA